MIDWRDMSPFKAIDLEGSFILGWEYSPEAGGLAFKIEASLWPGHPAYELPQQGEYTCYKSGELLFVSASVLGDLPEQSSVRPMLDTDGSADYGSFDSLTFNGETYHLITDFANVMLRCDSVELTID